MTEISKHGSISKAAMKADMDEKTARKYTKENVHQKEKSETTRTHRTRQDPLSQHWAEAVLHKRNFKHNSPHFS